MTRPPVEIRLGLGSCCVASGSRDVYDAVERTLGAMRATVTLRQAGCVGICHRVPLLEIIEPGCEPVMYGNVTPDAVPAILKRHVEPQGFGGRMGYWVRRGWSLLTRDAAWGRPGEFVVDADAGPAGAFFAPQMRITTEACGRMDPTDINEYRMHDGYEALRRAVQGMKPSDVVETILASQLRGRGGAGFPTGKKWQVVASQPPGLRYVICNGDEGDPGAFMDRMLLEAYPHRILEGAAIAAYAVGAEEVIFYIRQEYPLAVQRVTEAIRQATAAGVLGESVMGTPVAIRASVRQGSGAFVCGEETALIASIEGRRGNPRLRPPFPAVSGYLGRPTCVNNVETLGTVPWIVRHGAEAFAAIGTPSSKGTKVFSLTGKVARGGLIEVPMGMTIRQIVEEVGGGIKGDRGFKFKAVQIGGPSGGCIPAELADTPVDYEALTRLGAIMGSGGLVVLDESDCMVDIARYFLQFTQNESCGKCTFCRIGTKRMLEILNRLVEGRGRREDLDELETLAGQITKSSLCGLGQTAPNPVLTTLKYFRSEYEAHIDGRCPARKCPALIRYEVNDKCIGCTNCAQVCPADAIEPRPYALHWIDPAKCTRCDMCVPVCPTEAIDIVTGKASVELRISSVE
ncbi:MAG: Electron transport complex subunit RsxB [Phycisphaerae bacterium]|nr:Electron transport complex subunit RsxB [Phycisphaerae bacterium]